MTFQLRKTIASPFISSCSPILGIFDSLQLNIRINNIYERALRTICQDYAASFTDLLARDKTSIPHN